MARRVRSSVKGGCAGQAPAGPYAAAEGLPAAASCCYGSLSFEVSRRHCRPTKPATTLRQPPRRGELSRKAQEPLSKVE
jgi:hypothetical protein